ncbi:T9SS type A sorting domain-containing protein [Flavisolibacter tropicus]|uniref:Secretion system C-terminal sorting domain-containing protein n=1 Tax=Flavisolibacter tropicus TaxID=1492898 RepID=A0A172TQZ4_9BACT|nr:T9SS type A sorting domain-containing protein [Flavisolibacter tropicus]ANE49173.1 hypothetical protein SY85_00295 [Flavisolibacter tropicus]
MKKLSTVLLAVLSALFSHAQAVLNEIYANPSASNQEFFELYNASVDLNPISVDGYTLISYFENNREQGFYVLDLPNVLVANKGYFVGSSAIPFSYQGNNNVTKSNFNWNDPVFRSGATGGYLKKWYQSTANLADGNPYYDEEVLPLTFNDFFSKRSGSGASYNAFLYKNGVLVNSFVGGTGGNTFIPTFITNMPALKIETINNGLAVSYEVNYTSYSTGVAEYVIQDIGSDNGYMRESDGFCGTWNKSSSQAFHTPQETNGSNQLPQGSSSSLNIDAHISRGTNGNPSFIVYNVTSGTSSLFPVQLFAYIDNGTVVGQWDANDVFLTSNVENVVTDGPFSISFTPVDQQIILIAQTSQGCFDQLQVVPNPVAGTVLPLSLKSFSGRKKEASYFLEWVTLNNELASSFELEQSLNGLLFKQIGTISATLKQGEENYYYPVPLSDAASYRLKVIKKDRSFYYSNVLRSNQSNSSDKISELQNPVTSSLLRFVFNATETGKHTVFIYNSSGLKMINEYHTLQKGNNTITMELDSKMPAGMYLLEVTNGREKYLKRFVKY